MEKLMKKIKNKIFFGLIISFGFIQVSDAYDYIITNNSDESVTVQVVTSLLGAPKPKIENLQPGQTTTPPLQIKGFYSGACVDKIIVKGKKTGARSEEPYLGTIGVNPCGNKSLEIKKTDGFFHVSEK